MDSKQNDILTDKNADLMRILKFTAEDLKNNQSGKLSEFQAQNLREKMDEGMRKLYKIVYGFFLILILARGSEIFFTNVKAQKIAMEFVIYFVLITVIYIGLTRLGGALMNRKNKGLISGDTKVESLKGRVELFPKPDDSDYRNSHGISEKLTLRQQFTAYSIKIAGETLDVDKNTFSVFKDGANYKIYVVSLPVFQDKVKKVVVAAERMTL